MNAILSQLYNQFNVFLFVFVRTVGMFLISPIFGRRNMPTLLKAGFAFFISIIAANLVKLTIPLDNNIIQYIIVVIQELIVGLIMGYITYAIFSACFLAGQLIDMQIGLGMISVLDPQSNLQIPITGNLYYITAILVFFIINGHHILISALIESYYVVPIGKAAITSVLLKQIMYVFTEMFVIAIKVSIPIIGTIFIVDLTLGIISKTMPQLNIFAVGVPLKIVLGLIIVVLTMTIFINILSNMFDSMYLDIYKALKGMVR